MDASARHKAEMAQKIAQELLKSSSHRLASAPQSMPALNTEQSNLVRAAQQKAAEIAVQVPFPCLLCKVLIHGSLSVTLTASCVERHRICVAIVITRSDICNVLQRHCKLLRLKPQQNSNKTAKCPSVLCVHVCVRVDGWRGEEGEGKGRRQAGPRGQRGGSLVG